MITPEMLLLSRVKEIIRDKFKRVNTDKAMNFIKDLVPDPIKAKNINWQNLNDEIVALETNKSEMFNVFKGDLEAIGEKYGGEVPVDNTRKYILKIYNEKLKKIPRIKYDDPVRDARSILAQKKKAETQTIIDLGFKPTQTALDKQQITVRKLINGEPIPPKEVNYMFSTVFPGSDKQFGKMHPDILSRKESFKNI